MIFNPPAINRRKVSLTYYLIKNPLTASVRVGKQ